MGMVHECSLLPLERTMLGDRRLLGTVLHLPMVYGPGDHQYQLFPYLKRMDDGRPAILLEAMQAQWRCTRGYAENVAAAIVCVVTAVIQWGDNLQ
jgi:nucleoside-diphosphate-sugar epimerase